MTTISLTCQQCSHETEHNPEELLEKFLNIYEWAGIKNLFVPIVIQCPHCRELFTVSKREIVGAIVDANLLNGPQIEAWNWNLYSVRN